MYQMVVDLLTASRVEKIVRINLTLLRNLIKFEEISEDIVESHVNEVAQSLEYEKRRCTELYDDMREVVALISQEVSSSATSTGTRENSKQASWHGASSTRAISGEKML